MDEFCDEVVVTLPPEGKGALEEGIVMMSSFVLDFKTPAVAAAGIASGLRRAWRKLVFPLPIADCRSARYVEWTSCVSSALTVEFIFSRRRGRAAQSIVG